MSIIQLTQPAGIFIKIDTYIKNLVKFERRMNVRRKKKKMVPITTYKTYICRQNIPYVTDFQSPNKIITYVN